MKTRTPTATGASFVRRRVAHVASALTSVGLIAGVSLTGASAAAGATAADCTPGNTVDSSSQTAADIQSLLTANAPVVCLIGSFAVTTVLTHNQTVTIFGLSGAVLDGAGGTNGILRSTVFSADLTVQSVRFTNGGGNSFGGAIRGNGVTVVDSVFDNNSSGEGGAITGDTVNITGSTFRQNSAQYTGGAVSSYGVLTVESSTFYENVSTRLGGATAAGNSTITNSTFVANSLTDPGGDGAAIFAYGASTVSHSTFLNNDSPDPTGGQAIHSAAGVLTVRGNLFAKDSNVAQLALDGSTSVDEGGNIFTTTAATEVYFTATDPSTRFGFTRAALLGAGVLADNGGPTFTVALPVDSLAIGAVPAGVSPPVDQRGVARHTVSDAGAFEHSDPVVAAAALAATGADPAPAGILGALLLALGAAVVATRRRFAR